MVFHLRNLLHLYHCNDSPNPSPQQPPSYQIDHHIHNIHTLRIAMIAMACFVTTVMLLLTFIMFLRRHNHSHNHNHNHNRDRRNMPILFDVHGYRDSTTSDNGDDDDERIIDHHIWFIRTTGLQQTVIDSITVLKYRKDEGLVDGTECSVCLGEFQEEESLRILPKCSHSFHISCIDTWLRSHQNCPLCRAPVINDAAVEVSVTVTDSDQVDSNISRESLNQDGPLENFENVGIDNDDNDDDSDSGVSSSERSYKNNAT